MEIILLLRLALNDLGKNGSTLPDAVSTRNSESPLPTAINPAEELIIIFAVMAKTWFMRVVFVAFRRRDSVRTGRCWS